VRPAMDRWMWLLQDERTWFVLMPPLTYWLTSGFSTCYRAGAVVVWPLRLLFLLCASVAGEVGLGTPAPGGRGRSGCCEATTEWRREYLEADEGGTGVAARVRVLRRRRCSCSVIMYSRCRLWRRIESP